MKSEDTCVEGYCNGTGTQFFVCSFALKNLGRQLRLLFSCWLYGRVYIRDSKPLKTIAHSHNDSLRRIAKASLTGGEQMIEPFVEDNGTIKVGAEVQPLFKLIQSEEWPRMMERYLGTEPGTYKTLKPSEPGLIPPRRIRATATPSTPTRDDSPQVCNVCNVVNCQRPCLSPISRPPFCDSCGFKHFDNYNLCTLIVGDVAETVVSPQEPIDTVDEPYTPHTPQAPIATPSTMSPMINALTEATVASVIGNIDENTQVAVRTRITRSRATRMNLSATFDGFVPAANPNAWRDRDLI